MTLCRYLILSVFLFFGFKSYSSFLPVTGAVSGKWEVDSVLVTGNIEVPFLKSLTIKEGTKILFLGPYAFNVNGRLNAIGQPGKEILFDYYDGGTTTTLSVYGWKGMLLTSYDPEPEPGYYTNFKWCRFRRILNPGGGALQCDAGKTLFEDCIFEDIEANVALYSNYYHQIKLERSIFTNITGYTIVNVVGRDYQTFTLSNLTFANNKSTPIFYQGSYRSVLKVTNCIFWNSIIDPDFGYYNNQIMHDQYKPNYALPDSSTVDASYCIFDPKLEVGVVSGNYTLANPLFKNARQRDFSLTWVGYPAKSKKSPAIDNGDPSLGMDADGTLSDIGAKTYINNDRLKYSWANFSSDTTEGWGASLNVQFNNLSYAASAGTQYFWDFGDGTFSNEKSPVHQFTKRGTFDVKLVVADPGGHKDSLTHQDLITFWGGTRVTESLVSGTWTKAGNPYYIYTDLKVPANAKFEIGEGVEVIFPETHKIDVLGSFCVRGTVTEPVHFYPLLIEKLKLPPLDTNLYDVQIGERNQGWSGINMLHSAGSTDSMVIDYGIFEGMRYYQGPFYTQYTGFHIENVPDVRISNSTFKNIESGSDDKAIALTIKKSRAVIAGCYFNYLLASIGTGYTVLLTDCDSAVVKGNVFKDITQSALRLNNSFGVTVAENFITGIRGYGIVIATERYDPLTNSRPWTMVRSNLVTKTRRAILCMGVKFRIFNNRVMYNVSDSDPGLEVDGDSLLVYNNLIAYNSCTGRIGNLGSTALIITTREPNNSALVFNNTIVGNNANFYQPALFLNSKTKLYNNIIRNGGFAEIRSTNGFSLASLDIAVGNNIAGGYAYGSGNTNLVAGFVDSVNHDFRLASNSACIDKGFIPEGMADLMKEDYFGNPRPAAGDSLPDQGYAEYTLPSVQSVYKFVGSGSIYRLANWEDGKMPGFLPGDPAIQVLVAPETAGQCVIEGKLSLLPGTVFQIQEGARVIIKE